MRFAIIEGNRQSLMKLRLNMTAQLRKRVFTCITREDQLLILEYVDGSYTLPQIPGGTVKQG